MKPLAWLVEEFDSTGKLVWSGLMTSEPTEMSWLKDLKLKLHNVTITPLIADTKNIVKVTNVKKYDSKNYSSRCNLYKYIDDWNDWEMTLHEEYPCDNKQDLERREYQIMAEFGEVLNKKKKQMRFI